MIRLHLTDGNCYCLSVIRCGWSLDAHLASDLPRCLLFAHSKKTRGATCQALPTLSVSGKPGYLIALQTCSLHRATSKHGYTVLAAAPPTQSPAYDRHVSRFGCSMAATTVT